MKYESEVIHEILEQRGHELSSLHYESECIESWIEENKGSYPKLCDYQSEWLNYIIENPIGNFPYEIITTNSTATINNVVPLAYKSAILSGNTLVNLVNDVTSNEVGNYNNSPCKINVIRNLQNETLTIIFNVISLEIPDGADGIMRIGGGWSGQIRCKPTLGVNKVLYNCNQTSNSWLGVYSNSEAYNLGQRITISDVMVLKGDYTNIDISYFEGMQSVQMPVLTTSNEDGTKTNILTVNEPIELRGIGDVKDTLDLMTGEYIQRIGEVKITDEMIDKFTIYENYIKNFESIFNGLPERKIGTFTTSSISMRSDKMIANPWSGGTMAENVVYFSQYNAIIRVYHSPDWTLDEFKEWFRENKPTIQYELATPVVKTVDLMIINQDGETISKIKPFEGTMNIEVTGSPIAPTATLEIPVEAITQNLASFIDLEMEE